jgi:hypothetical protein
MSAASIQQMADRVADLMEDRLGARGTGLTAKMKSRGGALPRKVRLAATGLANAADMAQNPKLLLQLNHETIARDYDICLKHLTAMKRRSRLLDGTLAIAASIALSLFLVVVLGLALMRWRGLI